jgi:anaerobic magnesium-protoporphyrin IX monomethyl ester cyclase
MEDVAQIESIAQLIPDLKYRKKKVCLIEPPKYVSLGNFVSTIAMPPIGLAFLSSVVLNHTDDLIVIDGHGEGLRNYYPYKDTFRLRGLTVEEIVNRIPIDTEIIGISCMFTSLWPVITEIANGIKEKLPNVFLIIGGEHASGSPEHALTSAPFDLAVMGEGEETFDEILTKYFSGQSIENIAGTASIVNNKVFINDRRQRIKDIDDIQPPYWDLIPIAEYHILNQPHGSSQGKFMPILASRGCPFQCTFCTSPNMWTTKWIARTPKLVVDEMQSYMERYDATDFQFEDLTAIVKKSWVHEFCDEILSRKMNVTFQLPSGTRSEAIDYEVAVKLKKAGCHEFAFAPESGDVRILASIKKKVKLPALYQSARDAIKAGINVGCFFIIGFPEDDWKSVYRTYIVTVKCAWIGFTNCNFNAFAPMPNTELYNKLVDEGMVSGFDDEYLMSMFSFQDFGRIKKSYNKKFSDRQLTFLVIFGVSLFYFIYFIRKPSRIFTLIKDIGSDKSSNKSSMRFKSMLSEMFKIARGKINFKSH